jgi:phosphoglycerate dehydrogenase-like enzyme
MINAETLGMVKPGAWLINVARGRLDRRAGAHPRPPRRRPRRGVLDTFRDEPLPPMSSFYDLPNVIVTPHTAWSSGRVLDRSSSCSATTCAASRPASRCSTWSTRAPGY